MKCKNYLETNEKNRKVAVEYSTKAQKKSEPEIITVKAIEQKKQKPKIMQIKMSNIPDDETLLRRAFIAYQKYLTKVRSFPIQPANSSYVEGNVAVLINVNGELARYRYSKKTDRLTSIPVREY